MFTSTKFLTLEYFVIVQYVTNALFSNYPDIMFGKDTCFSVLGPMARSVKDIALWMKTSCDQSFHVQPDPYHRVLPFNLQ